MRSIKSKFEVNARRWLGSLVRYNQSVVVKGSSGLVSNESEKWLSLSRLVPDGGCCWAEDVHGMGSRGDDRGICASLGLRCGSVSSSSFCFGLFAGFRVAQLLDRRWLSSVLRVNRCRIEAAVSSQPLL
ncbi:unnamed protein product [Microthlaspi erraticum]|uniref:Uncharacterized protein n=1 Tax=Microthlaspi erraticum TaxID=1685480 RepID=A0A6D2IAZ3_9BRAS|nr:unnamed protein product [Microthlaspi erraticum]